MTHRFTQIIRKIAYNIKYTVKCQSEHTSYTCNALHLQQWYAVKTGIINPNICAIWKRGSLSSQYVLQGLETHYEHRRIVSSTLFLSVTSTQSRVAVARLGRPICQMTQSFAALRNERPPSSRYQNHPHITNLNSYEITKQSHHNKSSAQWNIETFVH